jgi:two-component system chemotaxis sensor kinase CheA
MSVDMSQFYGVFFEESQEHLEEMEHLLMELSLDEPDIEELNSIFRAAHSIKGGSGVFGFDALTGLTHVMENILDLARKYEIDMTKTIVDQLLVTVDTLKQILECYQNEEEIDWEAIEKGTKELEALLKGEADETSADASKEEDEGFGLYANPITETESEEFGFFESVEAVEKEDKSYGIYADEDERQAALAAQAEQDQPQSEQNLGNIVADVDDDCFGFFDDEPIKATTDNNVPTQAVADNSAPSNENDLGTSKAEQTPAETKAPAVQAAAPSETKTKLSPVAKKASAKAKPKAKSETKESGSIRVDTLKIDSLVNLVGELVITQSMIKIVGKDVHGETEEQLDGAINELSRNIREIQEAVMSMRMLPMSFAFNRFPRVVRDLADKLEKQVDLVIVGGATEIDKGLIEKLVDPLTHLIRNSIDHGIEMPAAREAAGKQKKGTVILGAEQRGGSIIITITDDGAGLNRERILDKAMANGLDVSPDMPDEKVWPLIFEAGFSTAEAVTDVSGRGVGMDVVRRNIESIGGVVEIESNAGEGSVFRIRLPLTLAIVDGMCVSVADQTFVVPLTNIIESMQPTADQLKTLQNDHLLWVRGEYWPLVNLYQMMGIDNALTEPTQAIVVLVETSRKRFGILVDALAGQQQVVIKSLEQHYKRVPGVAGATIMGDGSVAMILDVESIAADVNTLTPQEVSLAS